ncbi:hypothetical protein C5167_031507 [Papaver somniferum]|uniref:CCT domain-containing protein n=1 Tax=Papaver somniferum TaxID=3469 RepID=A0A4Y7K7R3_PAPSO|nr:two-component response regulator-like PRR73 [Papaver somniferum]RZC68251.1 hypothetical protein C5167_031507 [Papaver somniferum]
MYDDYSNDDLFSALSYSTTTTTTTTTDFLPYSSIEEDVVANSVPTYQVSPPPPILIPTSNDVSAAIDTLGALKSEVGYSSSSSYGSPSSLPSYSNIYLHNHHYQPSLFQRSMSSHSLLNHQKEDGFFHPIFSSHLEEELSPSCHGHEQVFNLDSDESPMRKVYSTGDLQTINVARSTGRSDSPLSNENCIEGLNKVGRYTAEERKERIERYRSKRNQRNFTKKIKYACRKTLADSRPRIRGRFARNDETGEDTGYNSCLNHHHQWNLQMGTEANYNEEVDDVWINFYEASLLC